MFCQSILAFHSLGVIPVKALNVRKNEVSLAKPDAIHTSEIFLSGLSRSNFLA